MWHAWAQMEATQGDRTVVRYLFKRALEINPRSRFAYVSWGLFEKEEGNIENARALFRQGHELNQNAAILQVSHNSPVDLVTQMPTSPTVGRPRLIWSS